ncbi:MAG: transcription termination factor Rho, partial [Acidimicrobiales bacterium]|nr:transcription termination factor Rho [Acidimicrobiales bacterium]
MSSVTMVCDEVAAAVMADSVAGGYHRPRLRGTASGATPIRRSGTRAEQAVGDPQVSSVRPWQCRRAASSPRTTSERVSPMADGPTFDPSMLERKDRAELVTIVESLGGKVPSRAKKADIVGQILLLVGHGADDEPGEEEAEAAVEATDEAAAGADGAGDDAAEGGSDDADAGANGGGARKDGRRGGGRAQGQQSGARSDDKPSGKQENRDEGDRNQGGPDQSGNQQQGNQQGQQQGGQGSQQGGQGGQGDQQGDDVESGNRRRRRRGRDRNRGDQDDVVQAEPVDVEGFVDLREEGYGFLRINGYLPSKEDAYVSVKQVRQFGLRRGDVVKGKSRMANRNEKNPALLQIDEVNGAPARMDQPERPHFDDLTPLFPDERLTLEQTEYPENITARIVDLIAPIGKGQRGLIVSPPKAGKTTVVKDVVRAIERNHPEVHVIVLLVDERPEEVTDMKRWMLNGEVAAATFDRPSEEHIALAELVIDRAKRMVEGGRDVVVVLDGITRLARAYNLAAPTTGRVMAGGIDAGALYPPKKFFGAARNVEEGGSLTILATALVETNTRMDEVIFEEFKGTGNMELRLDRRLAERRVYPAIDVDASSTRHEELLYEKKHLNNAWKLR